MKVWINYRDAPYSVGMILVAANSAEEAHKTFHADEIFGYMWSDWSDAIDDFYYKPNNWELIPMLEANVDKPQVIAEAGYTE